MTEKKHALLLFSKPPIPGLVKTRMTKANGGILTPEQSAKSISGLKTSVISSDSENLLVPGS